MPVKFFKERTLALIKSKYFKIIILIGIVLFVLIIILPHSRRETPPPAGGKGETETEKSGFFTYFRSFFTPEKLDYDSVTSENIRIQWVIEQMKERYSGKLANKGIQMRLLGGLIRYLKKSNPDDWKERVRIIIEKDFPDHASAMIDTLAKLEQYHKFMDEKKDELAGMTYERRKDTIQEKRKEIFGSEYYEIWKKTIAREEISSMLNKLDWNTELTLNDKLARYKEYSRELYANEPDASLAETDDDVMVRNYRLTKQFIDMPSVQAELVKMSAGERADFLRKTRESMGLPAETVDKMAELDKMTDELWKRQE